MEIFGLRLACYLPGNVVNQTEIAPCFSQNSGISSLSSLEFTNLLVCIRSIKLQGFRVFAP